MSPAEANSHRKYAAATLRRWPEGQLPASLRDLDGHYLEPAAAAGVRLYTSMFGSDVTDAQIRQEQEQAQQQNNGQTGQNGQQQPKTLTGDATEYNLSGAKLAYGGTYDSAKMAAAMTSDRAKNGQVVDVTYTTKDAKGNPVTTTIHVTVNDTGPFARGDNGKALHPLRPDPKIVIDLTPTAMKALTGSEHNRVPVTVTVPQP